MSARNLQDEYLPYYVLQLLNEHEITPDRLTLEITENMVMENVHHAISVLECLRDIGVRISMDDFGTGHSSLAQIKNLLRWLDGRKPVSYTDRRTTPRAFANKA